MAKKYQYLLLFAIVALAAAMPEDIRRAKRSPGSYDNHHGHDRSRGHDDHHGHDQDDGYGNSKYHGNGGYGERGSFPAPNRAPAPVPAPPPIRHGVNAGVNTHMHKDKRVQHQQHSDGFHYQ